MFDDSWTHEKDTTLRKMLIEHDHRERMDAARYRVLRDLIGSSDWPVRAITSARTPGELDTLADRKSEELDRIVREVRG
jgi:hypothetical protein